MPEVAEVRPQDVHERHALLRELLKHHLELSVTVQFPGVHAGPKIARQRPRRRRFAELSDRPFHAADMEAQPPFDQHHGGIKRPRPRAQVLD
jgi:hypothetical protein